MRHQTSLNIRVGHGEYEKHHQRQGRMNKVYSRNLVLVRFHDFLELDMVENIETFGGGNAIVEFAIFGYEAISEGREEADDGTDKYGGQSDDLV